MSSTACNHPKLKTNISVCIRRLDIVIKKKNAINLNARKEISGLLEKNKIESARIKVEQIVREDYIVEAMEILQTYMELLNIRFGLITSSKTIDPSLDTAIATIIWSRTRLGNDITELKEVCIQLKAKYGREHTTACQQNSSNNVNQNIISKLSMNAPDPVLIEDYLCEIAKSYNVPYDRKPTPLHSQSRHSEIDGDDLLDVALPSLPRTGDHYRLAGEPVSPPPAASGSGGGLPYPANLSKPTPEYQDTHPPSLPTKALEETNDMLDPPPYESPPYDHVVDEKRPLDPTEGQQSNPLDNDEELELSNLPDAPGRSGGESNTGEDINFDDLTKRFDQLKKKK